eukprot:m.406082 g.406082  ORF g.406082 m.406082 type:complete len:718 (+) comp20134_c1_seq48:409-2562(+)
MAEATGCHYPQQHQVEAAIELFHDRVLAAGGIALPVSSVSALLQHYGITASHAKYFAQAMSASTPGAVKQDEFVKGLAALDPVARHDDARKAFVFRVYQDDRTQLLDRNGLASMVRHIRRAKSLSTDSRDVAAATDKLCHRLGTSSLNLEDFIKATTFLRCDNDVCSFDVYYQACFTGTSELCRLPASPFPAVHIVGTEVPALLLSDTDTDTALDLEADAVDVTTTEDDFMAELETRLAWELRLHNINPTQAHAAMRSCCSGHGRAFAEAWVKVLLEQLGPPVKASDEGLVDAEATAVSKDHVLGVELPDEWQACAVCQDQSVNCRLPLSAKMKATPDLPPPDYHLIDIPTDSMEYSSIAADFSNPLTVKRVCRLQNRYTWARYCTSQKILCAKNQNMDANEQALYHCTRADLADICSEGLDYRYSNSTGNLGPGLYFSNNPLKCDSYAKPGAPPVVLRCHVTLGKVKTYPKGSSDRNLRVEPPGFQSVKGWFSVADEWCVKNSDQVYVSHLVFYEATHVARQPWSGLGPRAAQLAPQVRRWQGHALGGSRSATGFVQSSASVHPFSQQQPPRFIAASDAAPFVLKGARGTAPVVSAAAVITAPKVIKTVTTLDLAATPTQFIAEGKIICAGDTAPGLTDDCPICLERLKTSAAVRLKHCSVRTGQIPPLSCVANKEGASWRSILAEGHTILKRLVLQQNSVKTQTSASAHDSLVAS